MPETSNHEEFAINEIKRILAEIICANFYEFKDPIISAINKVFTAKLDDLSNPEICVSMYNEMVNRGIPTGLATEISTEVSVSLPGIIGSMSDNKVDMFRMSDINIGDMSRSDASISDAEQNVENNIPDNTDRKDIEPHSVSNPYGYYSEKELKKFGIK